MSKKKIIRFNYFYLMTDIEDQMPKENNIKPLIENIMKRYLKEEEEIKKIDKTLYTKEQYDSLVEEKRKYMYTMEYREEKVRLVTIDKHTNNTDYHLIFELLDYQLPELTKEYGLPRVVLAEDDEYIGHKISCLYDSYKNVIIIQNNINSLSVKAVEQFLNKLIIENGSKYPKVSLHIATEKETTRKALKQTSYRSLNMKLSGEQAKTWLGHIFNGEETGAYTIEIKISSGIKKSDELKEDFSKNIIENFVDKIVNGGEKERSEIERFKIKAREEEEDNIREIDLISHKVQTLLPIDFSGERTIKQNSIFESMVDFYRYIDRPFINKV